MAIRHWIIYGTQPDGSFLGISGQSDVERQWLPPNCRLVPVPDGFTLDLIMGNPDLNIGSRPEILAPAIWEAIKARRDVAIHGLVAVPKVGTFQASERARASIGNHVANKTPSVTWTDAADSEVDLSAKDLAAVNAAFLERETAAHDRSRELRKQLDAVATDVPTMMELEWETGWPDQVAGNGAS